MTPVAAGVIELDEMLDDGDRSVWAKSITAARARKGKVLPAVNLEKAITNIKISDTMVGSSTIVLNVMDEDWQLIDNGFFDANRDGRLDAIDVNYPEGTKMWWRCTQVGIDATRGGALITLTFMERAAVHLMQHRGPMKVSRAKRTRAQFIKMLSDKVKAGGGITFHCKQLNVKQRQADEDPKVVKSREKAEKEAKEDKDAGIRYDEKITFDNWDGNEVTLKPGQLRNAERGLREAFEHTDDERPLLAYLEACIVEAPFFDNPMSGHSSSVGILQLLNIHGPVSKRRDIAWVTMRFLKHGFWGKGGAIALAKQHKDWSPGDIAQTVQGSAHPDRYEAVRKGAEMVLEAFGGSGSGGGEYRKQYNFEVGTDQEPRETFWDAANRLAEEVKWALFLDGQHLYYDADTTLIKQKPVAIVRRNDPAVVKFNVNWDMRQIATEATLELVCNPFEFRAGEVLKLEGFGPASTGSTAKLPGRWLIETIERERFSVQSTFQLKQPEDPAPEPRSDTAQRQEDEGGGNADGSLVGASGAKEIVDGLFKIARNAGGDEVFVVSDYRAGDPLDHGGNNKDRAARDIAVRGVDALVGPPHEALDKAVVAIGEAVGRNYKSGRSGPFQSADNVTYKGFRIQIIWRTPKWGGHMGHIHVGAKRIGGPYTAGQSRGPQGLPGSDT